MFDIYDALKEEETLFLPWVYKEKETLVWLIEKLCDPDEPINRSEVISLIAKYFFAFIVDGSEHLPIPEKEIYRYVRKVTKAALRKAPQYSPLARAWWNEWPDEYISHCTYALSMLGDFSATLEIFLDIITRRIRDRAWNKTYRWCDLWTGSGILLLAQYIQARRNRLIPEKNIGIEIDYLPAKRANTLAQRMQFWEVTLWDVTNPKAYETLPSDVSFISNENLPNPREPFRNRSTSGTINHEPFFDAIRTLSTQIDTNTLKETEMFPRAVTLTNIRESRFLWVFHAHELFGIERIPSENDEALNEYNRHVAPLGILLEWTVVPLEYVGKRYLVQCEILSRIRDILGLRHGVNDLMYERGPIKLRRWCGVI